jgi:hypothetical protein
MTFRIFEVTKDGVARPVYREAEAHSVGRAPAAPQDDAAAAEWQRLRDRLREDAPPARPGRLNR